MKVLTFTSLWPNQQQPLHGLFVRERMKALAKLCPVKVVAPVPWFIPVKWFGQQYYRYTQVPRYEKQEMSEVLHPRYLVLPKILKWSDGWLMFFSLRQAVKRLRQEFPFDLIDAHWAYPDGYAVSQIARELAVPYTVTVRGNDITVFAQERFRKAFIRRTLMGAQCVICVARSLQELVIALGIPPEKTVVIENGVDPQKFQRIPKDEARRQLQLPQDAQIILSVGHLCERKGFHLLIEAVKTLRAEGENVPALKLLLVGGEASWDAYRDVLIRQITESRLQNLVSLVGPKAPEELKYWYSAADVFCLASSREGCPNVVLESLACGTPVVATAVNGTPDILSSPELGILVERNVESIHRGIVDAFQRTWDQQKIVEHAQQQYSWKKTATKVYAIFEEIVLQSGYVC
jgi:teichuronic acid biosynthesis glycosyltransferase TuaC